MTMTPGEQYGYLTVVSFDHYYPKNWARYTKFRCVCGKEVVRSEAKIRQAVKEGRLPSCGCKTGETKSIRKRTHGMSRSRRGKKQHPLYSVWTDMKKRCYNPSHKAYKYYGGRGIVLCDAWKSNFSAFFEDMASSWAPGLTIDRIDVNGNYTKANCRWVSMKEQCRNRRSNIYVGGVTASEFARQHGLSLTTVLYRVRHGWTTEELGLPAGEKRKGGTA